VGVANHNADFLKRLDQSMCRRLGQMCTTAEFRVADPLVRPLERTKQRKRSLDRLIPGCSHLLSPQKSYAA
jgi:hypothetical protein